MASLRQALIVGNSDGIGLAFTRRLLSAGWRVSGISRRPSPIDHADYEHTVLDVASAEYREQLALLRDRRGPFDVCVYCAGIGELFDPSDLSAESQVFRVNLVAAVDTASAVLPAMLERASGHFIGLSSIGDGISTAAPSYAASKAGLSSYLAALALALRPRGVHVSNVRLGFVDTKMAKSPVKPMMISVEKAATVLMRCLDRRPARLTHPLAMGLLVSVIGWITSIRLWFA